MGTSLSGLTPATTFDGLLKVGDNDPLTVNLKAISTGDGTDTILQLSTTALSIGGATTIDVGNGHPTADNGLYLGDGGKLKLSNYFQEGIINVPAGRLRVITSQGVGIGTNFGNTTAANTTLSVKGSGATSATTSLLVQNSAGTTGFQVDDGGNIGLGNAPITGIKVAQTSGTARFRDLYFGNIGSTAINNGSLTSINWNGSTGIGIANSEALAATAMLHIKGSAPVEDPPGTFTNPTALLVQNSAGANLLQVTDDGNLYGKTLNVSGLLKMNSGQTIRFGGSEAMSGNISTGNLDLGIHSNFTNTRVFSQLSVKGTGNGATTTALLVQNSDGTDMLRIMDGGADKVLRTSSAQIGSLEIVGANIGRGGGNPITFAGTNQIGMGEGTPTAKLHIKGTGNTPTTTALLVQNSDGTAAFKIQDDRKAVFSGLTEFSNNVQFLGANDTSSLNNMRFVVPGATKSFVINADYNLTNEPSALLEVQSTTKGFLPPRMTEGERNAIATPAVGLIVYQTDGEEGVYVNTTGGWRQMQLI